MYLNVPSSTQCHLWTEVITEKSKIMANSTNNIIADISMNGRKLEKVAGFK